MSVNELWSHFFKPEVRKQGLDSFQDGSVFLQIAGDTQIQAFVKGSSRAKVSFTAESIASPNFTVDCSCPPSSKGQLCKHIWATLLAVEKNHPDFLDSKKELNKITRPKELSPAAEKQNEFKKQRYEVQKQNRKLQVKEKKSAEKERKRKSAEREPDFPEEVRGAIQFFSVNGFIFSNPIDPSEVMNARKVLSRIFHPDKGGTHEEALLLNENYEILVEWATR